MNLLHRMRSAFLAAIVCVATVAGLLVFSGVSGAATPRVDLTVLVVTDGTPWVQAISQQLSSEGVPTTVVDLTSSTRPTITSAFLSDQLADGTPHAKFQGVVVPNDATGGLSSNERAALSTYEQSFAIRQIDAYVYPTANVGLNLPTYSGSLDGTTATATTAARSDVFRYSAGTVPFEGTPGGDGSYGYLANPMPDDPSTGAHFEPYVTDSVNSGSGTIAGVFTAQGRQQLVLTFAYNYYQEQFRFLAHGIVDWVTKGVHLGYWRNYFSTHIDDLFSSDSRWSDIGKCTPGEGDCAAGVPATTPIRMVPADVTNAVVWQQQNNYTLDFLYNGGSSVEAGGNADPLTASLLAQKNAFWWVNHTYTHQFLGCVQDFTVIPWRCQTDAAGNIVWVDQQTITNEIAQNLQFATANGLPIRPNELVGGEHSGTKILPQQPLDNPNFVNALVQNHIGWLGLDASREPVQRQVGSALGTPRHPINVFYNVGTARDEVSEYNWIYTSKANGGSGICENNPTTSCISPLNPATGWSSYILPLQTTITLGYVLGNDPRPFYMHQSNLAEDRLALQAVGAILSAYRNGFAANTPVVDQTLTDSSVALQQQGAWAQTRAAGTVTGFVQGGVVTVQGPAGTPVPVTVPAGTTVAGGGSFGAAYAGEQSAYTTLGASPTTLTLPSTPAVSPLLSLSLPLGISITLLEHVTDRSPMATAVQGTSVTITDPAGTHTLPSLAVRQPRPTGAPLQPSRLAARSQQPHRGTTGR